MKWVWLVVLATACTASPPASPPRSDDPRIVEAQRANEALRSERNDLAAQVRTLTEQLDDARRPRELPMWTNDPISMPSHWVNNITLPDTFTVHLMFTATRPVQLRILTLDQYAQFRNGQTIDAAMTYPAATTLDAVFHDTEGCAGYVLLIESNEPTVFSPNIWITYAPAGHPTGTCAR